VKEMDTVSSEKTAQDRMLVISIRLSRGMMAALTVVLLVAAFVGYLAFGQAEASASTGMPPTDGLALHDSLLVPVVPWYMNYQGVLKDSGGKPLTGQYDLTFTIYRYDQGAGSYYSTWSETHNNVQLTNGLFNVALGTAGSPLQGNTFTGMGTNGTWDGDLALGISVDGGAELTPRVSLGSVPYAHRAEYVNRFPAPHYDSDWQTISSGTTLSLTHNLGGDPDDYVVDLQFKNTGIGGFGVHQWFYGVDYDNLGQTWGAAWHNLTSTSIEVTKGNFDSRADQVRIRIWRID
jgi:hypothetical protein